MEAKVVLSELMNERVVALWLCERTFQSSISWVGSQLGASAQSRGLGIFIKELGIFSGVVGLASFLRAEIPGQTGHIYIKIESIGELCSTHLRFTVTFQ